MGDRFWLFEEVKDIMLTSEGRNHKTLKKKTKFGHSLETVAVLNAFNRVSSTVR